MTDIYNELDTLPKRLLYAREKKNLSQYELAEAVGMKQPSYYQLESGKTKRSRFIYDISKVLDVDVDWLLAGKGKGPLDNKELVDTGSTIIRHLDNEQDLSLAHILIGGKSEYDLVPVTYLDIKVCCGSGYINEDYPDTHTSAFTVEFLRDNGLPVDGKGLVLMHACGHSMGFTIPDGSLMLVNTNQNTYDNFVNNRIYVFNTNSGMVCRRAIKSLDGTVTLKSDNSDKVTYPDQPVTLENFDSLEMFGRVHYVFNKV